MALCPPPLLSELARAYRAEKLIVFAGSSLSETAGLPSRGELIRALKRAAVLGIDEQHADEVSTLARVRIPTVALYIANITSGLSAVLTTSMDLVLDRAFGGTWASFAGHKAKTTCPFPGLQCFDELNAEFFFGRQADVSAALQSLGGSQAGHRRWLFIDGASGVRKSSLVQADIVPKVRHDHLVGTYRTWLPAVMRIGVEPVWNLVNTVPPC